MPDASVARFWDRVAERYARKAVPDEGVYARKLELTRARLTPSMHMIEVGCGTGSTAVALAPQVASVRAVDLSPAMIAIARGKAAALDQVHFEVASVETLEVAPHSVDVVAAHSLLHLLADPEATLRRLRAWLTPGGLLVTSTPCLSDAAPWLRHLEPLAARLGLMPKLSFFGRATLEGWLDEAGFVIEHVWQPAPRQGVFHLARAQ